MLDKTYRVAEIVGSSADGLEKAIHNGLDRAGVTLRHLDWFQVTEIRGALLEDDTRQCIRVLDGLGHQLGHQPVTVIWDNLGAHHAGDLHAWAAPSRGWSLRTCRRTRRSWTRWRGCGPT